MSKSTGTLTTVLGHFNYQYLTPVWKHYCASKVYIKFAHYNKFKQNNREFFFKNLRVSIDN